MRHVILAIILASSAVSFCAVAHADELGDALAASYRAAHEAGDVEALKALVDWEGANESTREKIIERLNRYIGRPVETIEFQELSGPERAELSGYMPNLKPVGILVMYFEHDPEDTRLFTMIFVVGERDGRYLITITKNEK